MGNHFDRETMLAIIEEQKTAVLEHYAPYLLVIEAEVRGLTEVQPEPEHKPVAKVVTEELSDITCARKGCGRLLTKRQVKTGGKYCSRRCNGIANIGGARRAKTLNRHPEVQVKWKPTVVLEAGVGVTKGEV